MSHPRSVSIDDIRGAADLIRGAVERTPSRYSQTLSAIAGCDIVLKFENFQFTASFKERGALNKLISLSPDDRSKGVIAMSAGNHAQGVAYHAGRLGIPATVVMPQQTPFNKVKHTKEFGANVHLHGSSLTEANEEANRIAKAQGLTFVHPYDDPLVIAGQGTIALELIGDHPEIDCMVVPIGGGGLISGLAVAVAALKPSLEIYGVQTEAYPAMADIFHSTTRAQRHQTIAEGIAVKQPGELARGIIKKHVRDIYLVRETEIESALVHLLEVEKVVVEGAAAAAFAAVLSNRETFQGKKVAIVLTGGNIDMRLLTNVVLRELAREGRIQSIAIEIEDRPGFLARIAALVSESGGNILDVHHDRISADLAKSATLALSFEARDVAHAMEIRNRLERDGFILQGRPMSPGRGFNG